VTCLITFIHWHDEQLTALIARYHQTSPFVLAILIDFRFSGI